MSEEKLSLFVLGATGATGKLVVEQALQKGHTVTAFVRNPEKFTLTHPNLSVSVGNALEAQSITAALKAGQRIISCLGVGLKAPKDFHAKTAQAIIRAAQSHEVKRVVVLSTLGTGLSTHARTPFLNLMFRMMGMAWMFEDKAKQDELFLKSGLDVTIAHSALLSNAEPKGDLRIVAAKNMTRPGFFGPTVPRADVAGFLIQQADQDSSENRVVCLIR